MQLKRQLEQLRLSFLNPKTFVFDREYFQKSKNLKTSLYRGFFFNTYVSKLMSKTTCL